MSKNYNRQKSERKTERERGREETETSGIEQCTVYMNMGLWMFCKDLARLFLFIIHFVFGLFVAVVTINKPIYDIIEILLFNHSISYHMKARLESVYSSTFARKMKKKKQTEPTADLYRLCYQSFFLFLTISKLLNIIKRLSAHRFKCYIFFPQLI